MRQLRIVTLGDYINYYSYFLAGSMEGAIRCGSTFRPVPFFGSDLSKVEEQIDFIKPDIMFTHCVFNKRPHNRGAVFDMLRRIRKKYGTKVCHHMGDARAECRYPHDISDIVDIGLVNHSEYDKWGEVLNIKCIHWPYATMHQSGIVDAEDRFKAGVTFTGSLDNNQHHGPRAAFVEKLKEKLSVKTYPCKNIGNSRFFTPEVSSSSNAVLGFQMGTNIDGYQDVRPFQYIGAGALYFHDNHKNMNLFFEPDVHYVPYKRDDIEDFISKYHYYVNANPEKGDKIRNEGFLFCQKYHNWEVRVQQVIDILGGKDIKPQLYLKDIK